MSKRTTGCLSDAACDAGNSFNAGNSFVDRIASPTQDSSPLRIAAMKQQSVAFDRLSWHLTPSEDTEEPEKKVLTRSFPISGGGVQIPLVGHTELAPTLATDLPPPTGS